MFTLTRLAAALLLVLFVLWLTPIYDRLYDPERPLRGLANVLGTCGFLVGWLFLGGKPRALWWSAYLGVQAVVMAGASAALVVSVRDIFILGYRRQVREPLEALTSIPAIAWDYLSVALQNDFLILLGGGGVAIGVLVHVIDRLLDRRRQAR